MKRYLLIITGICVMLLSSASGRAEKLTHNFDDMRVSPYTLTWPVSNEVGVASIAPLLSYQCASSGTFDYDTHYVISLPQSTSYVTTSAAVDDLTKIEITRTPATNGNMKFWISTDNSPWTDITSSATYDTYVVTVPMPSKGNYYLKIGRTTDDGKTAVQIREIQYYTKPCQCLQIVVE